jgi:CRP/FNR family cyclic AMP-dependent transcriptional regulator
MTGAGDPFEPLHDEVLRNIAASGVVRTFPRNTVLINEGDVGDALFVILSGRVKVYSSNEAGREFVIDFHGAGEYVEAKYVCFGGLDQ